MKREDVPDELLVAGLAAMFDGGERLDDFDPDEIERLREALAAVLPVHKAMVRTGVAEEIEHLYGPFDPKMDEASGMAQSIVWHLRGLCDNCGGGPDSEPCGVLHRWRLRQPEI